MMWPLSLQGNTHESLLVSIFLCVCVAQKREHQWGRGEERKSSCMMDALFDIINWITHVTFIWSYFHKLWEMDLPLEIFSFFIRILFGRMRDSFICMTIGFQSVLDKRPVWRIIASTKKKARQKPFTFFHLNDQESKILSLFNSN